MMTAPAARRLGDEDGIFSSHAVEQDFRIRRRVHWSRSADVVLQTDRDAIHRPQRLASSAAGIGGAGVVQSGGVQLQHPAQTIIQALDARKMPKGHRLRCQLTGRHCGLNVGDPGDHQEAVHPGRWLEGGQRFAERREVQRAQAFGLHGLKSCGDLFRLHAEGQQQGERDNKRAHQLAPA